MTTRWKVWLAALGLFAAGLAVGSFVTVGIGVRALRRSLRTPEAVATPMERATHRIQVELTKELSLTPEQAALVRTELDRTAGELRRLRVETVAQFRHTLEESVHRIGAQLTPEQRLGLEERARERFERLGWTYSPVPENSSAPRP